MTEKLTFTPKEAAEAMGISLPLVYSLCKQSGFPCIHIGRKIVIPTSSLNAWLNHQVNKNGGGYLVD